MVQKRKEKIVRSVAVNGIKKNGSKLAAKLVYKVQNSLLQRNIRSSFDGLAKNKMLSLIDELSNENEQAKELDKTRN